MRHLYAARRAALIDALELTLKDTLELRLASGGLHLLAGVVGSIGDTVLAERARSRGYALHALSAHCRRARDQNALLLPFTNIPETSALLIGRQLKAAFAYTPR